jgi:hypothetical protein
MKKILVLCSLLLCGCIQPYAEQIAIQEAQAKAIIRDSVEVEQSGHLWLVYHGSSVLSIVHHPDCPCLKHEKEKDVE